MHTLEEKFEEELKAKMLLAKKECKYNPTRFNQMLARHGGVETAKLLIDTAQKTGNLSSGLTTVRARQKQPIWAQLKSPI